jgi:hypothetical protein
VRQPARFSASLVGLSLMLVMYAWQNEHATGCGRRGALVVVHIQSYIRGEVGKPIIWIAIWWHVLLLNARIMHAALACHAAVGVLQTGVEHDQLRCMREPSPQAGAHQAHGRRSWCFVDSPDASPPPVPNAML